MALVDATDGWTFVAELADPGALITGDALALARFGKGGLLCLAEHVIRTYMDIAEKTKAD